MSQIFNVFVDVFNIENLHEYNTFLKKVRVKLDLHSLREETVFRKVTNVDIFI